MSQNEQNVKSTSSLFQLIPYVCNNYAEHYTHCSTSSVSGLCFVDVQLKQTQNLTYMMSRYFTTCNKFVVQAAKMLSRYKAIGLVYVP